MKTLPELLLEKHQAAEPKLDAIREKVVVGLGRDTSVGATLRTKGMDTVGVAQTSESAVSRVSKPAGRWAALPTWKSAIRQVWKPALQGEGTSEIPRDWRQLLWSLRWHLAGLSAVWLAVLFFNLDMAPDPMRGAIHRDGASARQLMAALRENQKQLRELMAAPAAESAPEPPKPTPSPRSQVLPSSTAAA